MLALSCHGKALAMIKAMAAGEYEGTRGVTAWYRLTRSPWIQRAKNSWVGWESFQPQRCVKMSDISSNFELWESRIREYEKLGDREDPDKRSSPNVVSKCRIFQVTLSCGRVAFESMRLVCSGTVGLRDREDPDKRSRQLQGCNRSQLSATR